VVPGIIRQSEVSDLAATINIAVYSDALVVLGTAGIVVPLVRRFGLSPVLGYLGAGAILGPLGLGSFIGAVPLLYWFTVVDAKNVAVIADLGVVFLLFLIGLELSYERLYAMRRLVFGLGGLQVLVTTVLLAAVAALAGAKAAAAIILGSCLALSSTAIVLEVLSNQGRLPTHTGRGSFAILLAQDLAVIPILMFVSIVGANGASTVIGTIGTTLYHALLAVAVIVLVGRALLRPLFRLVAATGSSELFIAAILFVIVATGVVAAAAELSMALGAFVAGLLLAETEYRKAIEATIEPFKGLLLGIFFFTVGMSIDARELAREPVWLVVCVVGLIAVKAGIVAILCRLFRISWPAAIEIGLLLGPGGEFAFVGIGLAATLGVVAGSTASFTLAVVSLTMALIPLMASLAQRIGKIIEPPKPADTALLAVPERKVDHAIVVGHGRVGQVVCELLGAHGIAFTAVDHDHHAIARARADGQRVYYGDAASEAFLRVCGLAEASGIIITIHDRVRIDEIVATVRRIRPDVMIVARAKDAVHARHLYGVGVTDAVPETIEASLQLSEAALIGLGRQAGPVIASIHEMRDRYRHILQEAATEAGAPQSRGIKARSASSA